MAEEAPLVGESAACPGCGTEVLQKQMIPVLAEGAADGGAHAYLCVRCARARIDTSQTGPPEGVEAADEQPGELSPASPASGGPPSATAAAPT